MQNVFNVLRAMESQGASIQQTVTRIRSLNLTVIWAVRNLDRTTGTDAGGENKGTTHLK